MTIRQTKLIANGYKYPATITTKGERLYFKFGYNKTLIEEMKMMQGAKWDPASKQWSIADSTRNHFQLAFLEGQNPYHVYDRELIPFNFRRNPNEWPGFIAMRHQPTMASHVITRQYLILAAEMGTGKTITMIESMEWLWANRGIGSWIYVAPKSALTAVRLEFEKWKSLIQPQFLTYDAMRQVVENWPAGAKPPQGVIFDEASKVKTPNSKRSMAAKQIAHAIRTEWGEKGAVILMTGTPAPKSPLDWWNLAEIACPGFLREGTWEKLRNTLAIMSEGQNDSGQVFAKIVAWKDDERKCVKCGKFEDDPDHDSVNMLEKWFHAFQPSTNEVARLHRRLKGLVHTVFKKDCFAGNTLVLTRRGPRKIRDLANIGHAELYVMTNDGMKWIDCPVKSFGIKETYQLTFGDHTKIRATLNHEWLWQQKGIIQQSKLFTHEIREGKTELPLAPIILQSPDKEGYAHGFVYGDGTKQNQNHTKVELFGWDSDLKSMLLEFGTLSYLKRKGWQSYNDVVASLPLHWKELPTEDCSPEYALGFVLGLVAADGCVDEHLRIYQADEVVLERVRMLAIYAGLRVGSLRLARQLSPFDGSYKPLWYFSIQTYNIKPEWILRRDHRERLKIRGRSSATTITDIDWQSGQQEETFCAIVPEWHNFTLANGVITGNCLDLPEKQYRIIHCKPMESILNAAQLLAARGDSVIRTMTFLRELSDGFQYQETDIGYKECPLCNGNKTRMDWEYVGPEDKYEEIMDRQYMGQEVPREYFQEVQRPCTYCSGTGQVTNYMREAVQVPTPKEAILNDLIEEHEDIGRLVVYAGFTGSVDRCTQIFLKAGWDVIRVDGRGWWSNKPDNAMNLLKRFQDKSRAHPKIGFVGQPGAAGMGLTLTESPTVVYYSNDFNGESRTQSEDRIHRPGMDKNRGATIIDIIHLPTDELVLNNLKAKRRLELMSLGELQTELRRS